MADLESFEVHFQNMLALIPKDGTTPVHLKELFQRMVSLLSASDAHSRHEVPEGEPVY